MDIVGPITPQGCEYKLNIICLRSIGVLLDRLHRKKKSILIFIFILVLIYMKYLCTFALKPLYTLIVRDMKHTWNIHMSMLFTSHPRLKIKCQKLTRKNLFLLTRGYGLVIIFMGSYQIGSVSLNILFVLTVMHILRTSYDVYICAHGA